MSVYFLATVRYCSLLEDLCIIAMKWKRIFYTDVRELSLCQGICQLLAPDQMLSVDQGANTSDLKIAFLLHCA